MAKAVIVRPLSRLGTTLKRPTCGRGGPVGMATVTRAGLDLIEPPRSAPRSTLRPFRRFPLVETASGSVWGRKIDTGWRIDLNETGRDTTWAIPTSVLNWTDDNTSDLSQRGQGRLVST